MKKISAMILLATTVLMSCEIGGAEYTDEMDIVATTYDVECDFASKGTYSLPSQVVKITGDVNDPPEFLKPIYGDPILAQIRLNMDALGYTEEPISDLVDIQVLPAAWTSTTIVGGYWGGYYCWYYPYYCGGGWYYPYYPTYSSYTTGTLVINMVDPKQESGDGNRRLIWTGAMNGLLSGSYEINRVKNGIDQAFRQSSYLKTN